MTSYVVQVLVMKHLKPVTFGNIETSGSEGRSHAKRKAVQMVREHFGPDAKIINMALGSLTLRLDGPWEPWVEE